MENYQGFNLSEILLTNSLFINKGSLMMIYEFCDPVTKLSFYLTKDWGRKIAPPVVPKVIKCLNPFFPSYPRNSQDKIKYMNGNFQDLENLEGEEKDKLYRIYAKYTTNSIEELEKTDIPREYFLFNRNYNIFYWAYFELDEYDSTTTFCILKHADHFKYPLPTLLILAEDRYLKWDTILYRQDLSLKDYKALSEVYGNFVLKLETTLSELLPIQTLDVILWLIEKGKKIGINQEILIGEKSKYRDFECVKWAYENGLMGLWAFGNQCIFWGRQGLEYHLSIAKEEKKGDAYFDEMIREILYSEISLQDFIWCFEKLKTVRDDFINNVDNDIPSLIHIATLFGTLPIIKYFYKNYLHIWQKNEQKIVYTLTRRGRHFIKWYDELTELNQISYQNSSCQNNSFEEEDSDSESSIF